MFRYSSSLSTSESTFSRPFPSSTPPYSTNRKRTASTSERKNPVAGRQTPSGSSHTHSKEGYSDRRNQADSFEDGGEVKKEKGKGRSGLVNSHGMEKAPSLDVDIRNSLILPSLSQRFSVLLPSLSTAPEESLRSLLASQRARHHGPALTEEEEEMLFAEMRDQALDDQWDGRPPHMDENWARTGMDVSPSHIKQFRNGISPSVSSPSLLTTSTSSPSVLASSDDSRGNYIPTTPASFLGSPPPTSSSFSSFKTFGVGSSPDNSVSPTGSAFKTKSYGFSGGSGMREAEYMRKVKKSCSHKDLKDPSINPARSDDYEAGTPTRESVPLPPAISPEKANAYYKPTKRAESPTNSEKTATPTSNTMPNIPSMTLPKGHSRASSLNFNPPTPTSAEGPAFAIKQQKSRKRQSRLNELSPAQVKRISMALQEIGGQLKNGNMTVRSLEAPEQPPVSDEVEEILDPESRRESQADEEELLGRARRPSDLRSEDSCQSATSSVFPFQMSPTNSTFTGTTTEPSSPSRLPPSPRTHNLLAHVEEPLPPIPMPVFTPTRSQPVRHQPTLSNTSTSTISPDQPVYIPGQPRPIRLTHHSQSSTSSRSATPSNPSPLDALRTAISPENTPSPIKGMPGIQARTSSLGRSSTVSQAQSTPTRPGSSTDTDNTHSIHTTSSRRRAGTIGEASLSGRMSSPYSSNPSTPDIIEESEGLTSDRDDYPSQITTDEWIPEVKQVVGRRSVANSRSTSEQSIHQLQQDLGWGLAVGQEARERTVSAQGTIDESDPKPLDEASESPDPLSPANTLIRAGSTHSTSSSSSSFEYDQIPDEIVWASVFDDSSPKTIELNTDGMISPEPRYQADILRKMSGMGMDEMRLLQEKLVTKAKAEREALRGDLDESPVVPFSPPIPPVTYPSTQRAMSPAERPISPILARPISPPPPSSWRFPPADPLQPSSSHTTPSQEKSTLNSSVDTHILTPPLTGNSNGATVSRAGSKSNGIILPTGPAPKPPQAPPADTPSDIADEIKTPPSTVQTNDLSARAYNQRLPLEQNPDIRRDFEARIAAATAALNRTPSVQQSGSGSKLDRKFSKKGGPMVISSPKLVSSTANVPTTPLTPESSIDSGSAKNMEKSTSGGSKMSLKWKKFTSKRNKGPSFSGNEVTPFPPQPDSSTHLKSSPSKQLQQQQQQRLHLQQQQQNKLSPIQDNISLSGGHGALQRSASASVAQKLEDPNNLRANDHPEAPPSAPPNLDSFQFPPAPVRNGPTPVERNIPSPPSSSGHSSSLRHVMSKMKRSKDASPPPHTALAPSTKADQSVQPMISAQGRYQSPADTQNRTTSPSVGQGDFAVSKSGHTPTHSDDDARAKFIEAGRALGLTEDQLNDMLAAKGMKGTVTPTASGGGSNTPDPIAHDSMAVKPEKEKKGLFRSLSKARKTHQPPTVPSAISLAPSAPIDTVPPIPTHDRVVVRRTMILPEGLNIIPSTPQTMSTTPKIPESPDSSSLSLKPGAQPRKQSIRRKPLQLSKEDHELVSGSPPAHQRNFSFSNASASGISDSGGNTPAIGGLGTSNEPSPANSQNQVPTLHSALPAQGDLSGLGFLHPNTPLNKKSSGTFKSSPGNDSTLSGDDESHTRSSTGGSLIDMYRNDDEEEMLESPTKKGSLAAFDGDEGHQRRTSDDIGNSGRPSLDEMSRRRMTQAVEITEYADGQVIWNVVDALRTSVAGSIHDEEYIFDSTANPHSRSTSYSSSVRNSIIPENGDISHPSGQSAGWPKALSNGTAGLNFRHRDRNVGNRPRPPTDVYFTSHRDVADLIDHLSRDLDASHGRIDIISHSPSENHDWSNSTNSPFVFQDTVTPTTPERNARRSSMARSMNSQFEDAPSPAQLPIKATPTRSHIPSQIKSTSFMENLSPPPSATKRQLFTQDQEQEQTGLRGQNYNSTSFPQLSPSSKSFASSVSAQGNSVEDRLQALLDRLKGDGIGRRL
ncbi:uncharacterized protein I206_106694 [Kwoniella pini CBS 10737]|uniref:Uncharacterized protein n=1 Tax=Kwoniella pini CBS 10737 TaxID=1296096 RepID=A0A1B9HTH0_9TREE|nr:uncharacterized protein I206_07417 [Kwoniella pini CBS 10737]OCF46564.1 hypothetical protein I206_07417 [Kwoniella pini CBS 10737]